MTCDIKWGSPCWVAENVFIMYASVGGAVVGNVVTARGENEAQCIASVEYVSAEYRGHEGLAQGEAMRWVARNV